MSSLPLTLEEIAKELGQVTMTERPTTARGQAIQDPQQIGQRGSSASGKAVASYASRFGEVLQSFLKYGYIVDVARDTGISEYLLRRHFFGNPEFCNLLRSSNETIFLEATQSIRDNQQSMVEQAQRLAQDALNEMERLLNDSESEHIRFRVAQDLLDRDPRISRTKRIEQTGVNITIESKTLDLAMEAAREIEARDVTPKKDEPR